jgi:hypothetical protein
MICPGPASCATLTPENFFEKPFHTSEIHTNTKRMMHIWITHLHITKLEMNAMLVELHYMINIIHATPRYHSMHTLLTTESYTTQLKH